MIPLQSAPRLRAFCCLTVTALGLSVAMAPGEARGQGARRMRPDRAAPGVATNRTPGLAAAVRSGAGRGRPPSGLVARPSAADAGERLALPHELFSGSFDHPPYVHPKIVQDLTTWLSDNGDQVVAINLLDAQDSNRYSGGFRVRGRGRRASVCVREGSEEFGYEYVGTTESGVHVLATTSWSDDGTGVFKNLLLLTIERDLGISWDEDRHAVGRDRERLLVRKLGEIPLGDRWFGRLRVRGDRITIGDRSVDVP